MHIELRCEKCRESAPVPLETLLDLWKQGYDRIGECDKNKAIAVVEISCYCGHQTRYNSPMFKYIFQLIFDEFVINDSI